MASTPKQIRDLFDDIIRRQEAWKALGVPDTAPTPDRLAALTRAVKVRDLLLRAMRTIGDSDARPENVKAAISIVDKFWEPLGHDVDLAATMSLLHYIERAAHGDGRSFEIIEDGTKRILKRRPEAELAEYRQVWGRNVDAESFLAAVRAKEGGGNAAWWPHAYAAIKSAGFTPQSLQAVKKAWKRWRSESMAERLFGAKPGT